MTLKRKGCQQTHPIVTFRAEMKMEKSQLKQTAQRKAKEGKPVTATNIVIMSISIIMINDYDTYL